MDLAVREILLHVIQEACTAVDRRVRQPVLVPADADHDGFVDRHPVGQQGPAHVTALVHRHAEIGHIVIFFQLGIDVHVGNAFLPQPFGQDGGLAAEHRRDDDAVGVASENFLAGLVERVDVKLLIPDAADEQSQARDAFFRL